MPRLFRFLLAEDSDAGAHFDQVEESFGRRGCDSPLSCASSETRMVGSGRGGIRTHKPVRAPVFEIYLVMRLPDPQDQHLRLRFPIMQAPQRRRAVIGPSRRDVARLHQFEPTPSRPARPVARILSSGVVRIPTEGVWSLVHRADERWATRRNRPPDLQLRPGPLPLRIPKGSVKR
jgi:hypothetical protein